MRSLRLCFGMTFLVILFVSSNVAVVSAHELETNNNVSVVMHIPPSDSPEANQTTTLNFFFGNTSGTFQLENYNIDVNISIDGRVIQKSSIAPAFGGATVDGATSVVFPKVGTYIVELVGTNEKDNNHSFKVQYNVNVERSATGNDTTIKNKSGSIVLFGATILVAVIMLACQQIIDGGRYKHKKYRS